MANESQGWIRFQYTVAKHEVDAHYNGANHELDVHYDIAKHELILGYLNAKREGNCIDEKTLDLSPENTWLPSFVVGYINHTRIPADLKIITAYGQVTLAHKHMVQCDYGVASIIMKRNDKMYLMEDFVDKEALLIILQLLFLTLYSLIGDYWMNWTLLYCQVDPNPKPKAKSKNTIFVNWRLLDELETI